MSHLVSFNRCSFDFYAWTGADLGIGTLMPLSGAAILNAVS